MHTLWNSLQCPTCDCLHHTCFPVLCKRTSVTCLDMFAAAGEIGCGYRADCGDAGILICCTRNTFKVTWFIPSDLSCVKSWLKKFLQNENRNLCFTAQKKVIRCQNPQQLEPTWVFIVFSAEGYRVCEQQREAVCRDTWVFKNEGMEA